MIDPLGPDMTDPNRVNAPVREVGSLDPEEEKQAPPKPLLDGGRERTRRPGPASVPSPARTALTRANSRPGKPSGFNRAMGVVRAALPVVQKLLPLLEGNVAYAAANFLTSQGQHVDLVPLEKAVGKLQEEQRSMRGQVAEHRTALQQVQDELAAVKEAAAQSASDQRELAEHLLVTRQKISRFTWIVVTLLVLSIVFNFLIIVRMAYILRP